MPTEFGGYNPEKDLVAKPKPEIKKSTFAKLREGVFDKPIKKAMFMGADAMISVGSGALEGCSPEEKDCDIPVEDYFGDQQTSDFDSMEEGIYKQEGESAVRFSALRKELESEVKGSAKMTVELERIIKSEAAVYYSVQYSASTNGLEKKFNKVLHDEEYRTRVNNLIEKYCKEFNVPEDVAFGVAALESGFCMSAESGVGAKGVYQMMDNTSSDKRLQLQGADALEKNIYGGIKYLSILYERYGQWSIAMMAYSTGPESLRKKLRDKAGFDYEKEHGGGQGHYQEFFEKHDINAVTLFKKLGGMHPFQYPFYVLAVSDFAQKVMNGEERSGHLSALMTQKDFRNACHKYPRLMSRIKSKVGDKRAREIFKRLKVNKSIY